MTTHYPMHCHLLRHHYHYHYGNGEEGTRGLEVGERIDDEVGGVLLPDHGAELPRIPAIGGGGTKWDSQEVKGMIAGGDLFVVFLNSLFLRHRDHVRFRVAILPIQIHILQPNLFRLGNHVSSESVSSFIPSSPPLEEGVKLV